MQNAFAASAIATGFAAEDCQWRLCPSHCFFNEQTVFHHHRD
jgi:hypothetical protein